MTETEKLIQTLNICAGMIPMSFLDTDTKKYHIENISKIQEKLKVSCDNCKFGLIYEDGSRDFSCIECFCGSEFEEK